MEKNPIIGVCPLWDAGKNSYWMLPGYMDGILDAGGVPIILPLTEDAERIRRAAEICGGFLFTGGPDVSPGLYGKQAEFDNVDCCPQRDRLEALLLEMALNADKPVLGICRGIQLLNAFLGGTLYQDLPSEAPSPVEHHQKAPYDVPIHEVVTEPGSPLADLAGARLWVNSCHHQAIRDLSPRLRPMAAAPDGILEAVYMPDREFVWAVQWHPEFFHGTDENSRRIFRAFVESAARN